MGGGAWDFKTGILESSTQSRLLGGCGSDGTTQQGFGKKEAELQSGSTCKQEQPEGGALGVSFLQGLSGILATHVSVSAQLKLFLLLTWLTDKQGETSAGGTVMSLPALPTFQFYLNWQTWRTFGFVVRPLKI